jgi:hypothetical protein
MENRVIDKPWGFEYITYINDIIAILILHINKNKMTSLHCHPKKTTGLIVLRGSVQINFIDSPSKILVAPANESIFRGRFHQIVALSDDVILMEVETPIDCEDIVRLTDNYGRADNTYNSTFISFPENIEHLNIIDSPQKYNIYGKNLSVEFGDLDLIKSKSPNDIVVFLRGSLIKNIVGVCHNILIPGDIVKVNTINIICQYMGYFSDDSLLLII